jgi:hypothetical protein
VLLSLKEVMIQ